MFPEYPYMNFQDLNLDFILKRIKVLEVNLQDFIKLNTIKYADPIDWNISKQYEANTVIVNDFTGVAYLSTQPVPSGVDVTNTDYWTPIFTLDFVNMNKNITLRNDGDNNNATFPSMTGDWLIVGGQLYKVIQDIALHTAYVIGYNIEIYSVEMFIKDYVNALANDINNLTLIIGDLTDLDTTDKTSIVNAVNELVSGLSTVNDKIGDLADLDTTVKDNVVNAINELIAVIGDLTDLNTSDTSSVVNAINSVKSDIDSVKNLILNPLYFGAACDRNVDDSQALQDMFDYALAHHIGCVNFDGIAEISFKNVEIKSNVNIDFGSCKFYGVAATDSRIYRMFYANNQDIDISINGGEFIGRGANEATTNASTESNPPLIDIVKANSVVITNGFYHNINNTNEGALATTPLVNRCGGLFRIHDTHFTSICNNIINRCYSSEIIWILNINDDREYINCEIKNNVFNHLTTTAYDFVGNYIEVCGNQYNYDYMGSVGNTFGLNVYVHDEYINGYFYNGYDNCEHSWFQGENFIVENITIKETSYAVRSAARNTRISNVHVLQPGNHSGFIGYLEPGYGGDSSIHPDIATAELNNAVFTIENCDMSDLDGNVTVFLYSDAVMTNAPLITIKNCIFPKITQTGRVNTSIIAYGCIVKISDCVIYARYAVGFSSNLGIGVFLDNTYKMQSISINNCTFIAVNLTDMASAYLIGSDGANVNTPTVLTGNNGIANVAIHLYPNSHLAESDAGNYGFT